MRVLIVDDSEAIRNTGADLLRDEGHDVVTACDGQESLRLFADTPIDAVILDISMPRMNGVEAARRLRALNASVPIFAFTGRPDLADTARHLFTHVFKKPGSFMQVCAAVTAYVEQKSSGVHHWNELR